MLVFNQTDMLGYYFYLFVQFLGVFMVNHARYAGFLADKHAFFSGTITKESVDARAEAKPYSFLADNHSLLVQEFDQMFASLEKQGRNRREFWFYCYYCCQMLESYYTSYHKLKQAKKYRDEASYILHHAIEGSFADPLSQARFIDALRDKLTTALSEVIRTPKHTSDIEQWLGFTNIYRIHFTFCRIFVRQSVLFARELQWLEQLQGLTGTTVEDMVASINGPAQIFYTLSVGLMVARFMLNAGMLLKHTLCAGAKERDLSMQKRFMQELYNRHCTMLNDLVWGTVNLVTNYPALLNVSAPMAGWLTAGFMCFDISLLFWRRYLNQQEYELKKAEYEAEKRSYIANPDLNAAKNFAQLRMIDDQLKQLEINHKAKEATYIFTIVAAMLLLGGFTASMLVTAPAALVALYLVCTLAVAMYLTADIYGNYKKASFTLAQLDLEHEDTTAALKAVRAARDEFILAMVKNIIVPLLIITLFAVSWQAALLFVGVYLVYELMHSSYKHAQKTGRPELVPLGAGEPAIQVGDGAIPVALPPPSAPPAANDHGDAFAASTYSPLSSNATL